MHDYILLYILKNNRTTPVILLFPKLRCPLKCDARHFDDTWQTRRRQHVANSAPQDANQLMHLSVVQWYHLPLRLAPTSVRSS